MEGVRPILILKYQQSRPEEIFWAALFLSVLIHLLVIVYLKLPALVEPMRAKMALSVILAKSQEVGQPTPVPPPPVAVPITLPPKAAPVLPLPEPPARQAQKTPPIDIPEPMPKPMPEPQAIAGETLHEKPADPVEQSLEIVEAAKVQALLLVDENGEVERIVWNTLPAITDKILLQMEQHLRSKIYLATGKSYTLYEIVEIPRE